METKLSARVALILVALAAGLGSAASPPLQAQTPPASTPGVPGQVIFPPTVGTAEIPGASGVSTVPGTFAVPGSTLNSPTGPGSAQSVNPFGAPATSTLNPAFSTTVPPGTTSAMGTIPSATSESLTSPSTIVGSQPLTTATSSSTASSVFPTNGGLAGSNPSNPSTPQESGILATPLPMEPGTP